MNSKILAPERTIGAITIKKIQGGEISIENVYCDIHNADETALYGFTKKQLRDYLEELKDDRGKIPIKNRSKRTPLTKRINAVAKVLNSRRTPKFKSVDYILSTKEYVDTIKYLYEIENLNESMIRGGINSIYEIKNGDSMKNKVKINEITNEFGQPDYKVIHERNVPESNEGALKMKDIVALYYSNRLYLFDKPLNNEIKDEGTIINTLTEMMKNPLIHLKVRIEQYGKTYLVPIRKLERRVFSLNDRSKEEISFLLNLKGDAIKVGNCEYYEPEEEKWIELKAISYNQLNYEHNHVVVIALPRTLKHIENRVKKLHKEYSFFENKEGKEVHKIYGLRKYEEIALKNQKKDKTTFDESEIQELFDILKKIDGRQTIRNIEYDIKAHTEAKYILNKKSDELYFLKMALEDTPEYAEEVLEDVEYESYLEIIGYLEKQMKRVTKKKVTALRNVVTGLHLRYEDEEDLGKYLSDELDEVDKISQDRNFSFNKTHRNYYSQTEGVLVPNGNPQTTHKRKNNPPSMSTLRILRKRNLEENRKESPDSDFLKEVMNFEKEYERVFGVKTPTPSSSSRVYPWYPIHDILGLGEEDKDVLLETFSEISGYLSENKRDFLREAIFTALGEKYPAPQFRVPEYKDEENNLIKICNLCKNESKCFCKKAKIIADKINSPKPIDWFRGGLKEGMFIGKEEFTILKYIKENHIPFWFFNNFSKRKTRGANKKRRRVNKPSSHSPLPSDVKRIRVKINGKKVLLYAKGDLDALYYPRISIAGTRTPSSETVEFVKKVIKENVEENVIISGLAMGCDTIAHKTTLEEDGITIAVLPCGFNNITPSGNKELAQNIIDNGGLLLSEYPPEEKALRKRYIQRNRIIAGLAKTVIICEGGKGTAHTKRFAKEQGKNIIVQKSIKK